MHACVSRLREEIWTSGQRYIEWSVMGLADL